MGIPQLDPAEDMLVKGQAPLAAAAKLRILQARLRNNAVHKVRALPEPCLLLSSPHPVFHPSSHAAQARRLSCPCFDSFAHLQQRLGLGLPS